MKIDSHLHLHLNDHRSENFIRRLDERGVDRCWLMTWEEEHPAVPRLHTTLAVEEVLAFHKDHPDRIVPMYAPDPRRSDCCDILKAAILEGIQGCAELKVSLAWDSQEIGRYLACLDKLQLPLVFHMEGSSYRFLANENHSLDQWFGKVIESRVLNGQPRGLLEQIDAWRHRRGKSSPKKIVHFPGYLHDIEGLERRLREFPGVCFIAHGPLFWKHLSAQVNQHAKHGRGRVRSGGTAVRLLETYPNLYADLSGVSGYRALSRDRVFAKVFLQNCYRKILFGTDNQTLGLEELLLSMDLEKHQYDCMMGLNAEKLIGRSLV